MHIFYLIYKINNNEGKKVSIQEYYTHWKKYRQKNRKEKRPQSE